MSTQYKILHLEDLPEDAELVARELKAHKISFDHLVVDTESDYVAALTNFKPDVILSDHCLPAFNSFEAFKILKAHKLNIPFIIITATMTEQVAMTMVRNGADDYILKDRLKRLPHAVLNAIQKYRFEKDRKNLVDEGYQNESFSREVLNQFSSKLILATRVAGIGVWEYIMDTDRLIADDVMLSHFNLERIGYTNHYNQLLELVHPDDKASLITSFSESINLHEDIDFEYRIRWADGSVHYIRTATVVEYTETGKPVRLIGTHQDITTEKLAYNSVKDSERRLSEAQAVAKVGSWETDLSSFQSVWSQQTWSIFGFLEKDRAISHNEFLDFVHPSDRQTVNDAFLNSFLSNTDNIIEHRILLHNGKEKIVEERWHIVKDQRGLPLRAIGTVQDITERKKAQQTINESEAKFKAFFEHSLDGILLSEKNGNILAANPRACEIFGGTEEEIRIGGMNGLIKGSDPELLRFIIEENRTGGAGAEITFRRRDQSTFQGEISSKAFLDAYGTERISTFIRDISVRKVAESNLAAITNELQQTVNRLTNIMDSSLDIICTIDSEGRFVTIGAASERIWGFKPVELVGKNYFDFVYADDVNDTINAAEKVMNGIPLSIFENRYVKKDGTVVPLLWSARWDTDSKLMYCIAKDATEKKRREKAFSYEKQRFIDMFSTAPASLGIFKGPDHVFEMANDGYLSLTGRSNIIGKTVREVFPEIEHQGIFELLDSVYNTGDPVIGREKLIMVDKGDGNLVPIYQDFMYQAYKDFEGNIEGIFFFAISVTEQVASRKKVEESEKRYADIIQNLPGAIYTCDIDGRIMLYNRAAVQLWGKEPEPQDRWTGAWKLYNPDGTPLPADHCPMSITVKEGVTQKGIEKILEQPNGQKRHVLYNPVLTEDTEGKPTGGINMLIDITDQKKSTESLRRSEERYRQIVDTAQEGIWVSDEHNKTTFVNNKLCEILEYSPEEMFGKEMHSFMDDEGKAIANEYRELQKQMQDVRLDLKYISKKGRIVWTTVSTNRLFNRQGGYKGSLAMITDITGRKLSENRLKENEKAILELNNNLTKHASELAASNEELERFAYVTSHDLQEPLRMVSNFLELLQQKYEQQLDANAHKYINFAVDGATRMKSLILDLLEFSRITSVKIPHSKVDLNEVLIQSQKALKILIDESAAEISFPSLPDVRGNSLQLTQLFQNLIGNAIKYRGAELPKIEMGFTEEEEFWQFYVKDNGIGIDERFFEKIFVIFQRLHNKNEYSGTGIGLAICKKIVELHRGKIWLESAKNKGSTFYFTINKTLV